MLVKDNVVITLAQVAELKVEPLLSEIRRFNRQTTLAIGMNMNKDLTMDKAREELTEEIKSAAVASRLRLVF